MKKVYLGDSVHAHTSIGNGHLVLTTDGASNEIFLEPDVVDALLLYIDAMREEDLRLKRRARTVRKLGEVSE